MNASADNPLLGIDFSVPFDRIRPAHIEPAVERLIAEARAELVLVENANRPLTYEATFGRLDRATARLETAMTVIGHLESVCSTPELRDAYNRVRPEVNAFFASIPLMPKLWAVLKEYAAGPPKEALTAARQRFVDKTIDDFRRHGAELDDEGKQKLDALTRELARLTARFSQNVLDATAAWELCIEDEERLSGLPESARVGARESARKKGKAGWRFTLQAPSLVPLLTYLDDAAIREEAYRAYNTRATEGDLDNVPLITQILDRRKKKAELLGYANFAELVLEDRMAKNAKTARDFVEDLTARTRPAFEREHEELSGFRRELEGASAPDLAPWDLSYYAEKRRKALYDFDEEQLRPYFELDRVVQGLFETARRLYGVQIVENSDLPVWHADVRGYDLKDADGTFLASFYTDFYPREEKRGGAWMNGLIAGVTTEQGSSPHLGLICANVTPPAGDRPSLLSHAEVTTLFHEFGHLLHHCLSRVEVRSLAGTNVAWDFVELPSQIMENWCWEREALDLFARHHETGEPIPEALFEKMTRARTYREATAMMRQLGFAAVDLALHIDYDPERDGDPKTYARAIMQRYAPAPYPQDYAMIAGFSHLFSSTVGYAAGYYSYKWAEVLEADAFTRFKKDGVYNPEVGAAFRASILSRGDGDDPMRLYKDFMGREPRLEALLERSGLQAERAA